MFSTVGRLEMFKDEETQVPFHVVKYLDQDPGNAPKDPRTKLTTLLRVQMTPKEVAVFLGRSSTKVTQPWVNRTQLWSLI